MPSKYTTVLAPAARTSVPSSALVNRTNQNAKGIVVVVDLTDFTTAASLAVTIQGYDPVSGKYYTILASATIVANSTIILRVYPGLTAATNLTASDVLPPVFRINVVQGNGNSHTYSIAYQLIP